MQNSPGERVRKLKAMFARGTMVSMQLSPLVSMKSWRVMAVGSMWCSLNGRIKACRIEQTVKRSEKLKIQKNVPFKNRSFRVDIMDFRLYSWILLPFQRWVDPLIPTYQHPSEQVLTQSLRWGFLPLKTRMRRVVTKKQSIKWEESNKHVQYAPSA